MTDDQKAPETDEATADAADVEQDVEGHKIPRPGGTQGGLTPDEGPGPAGFVHR